MGRYRSTVQDHLVMPAQALLTTGTQLLFRQLGRPVVGPVATRLLIDTGSKRSSLVPSVLNRLSPPSMGVVRVETSLASLATELFAIRLEFAASSLAPVPLLAVARLPLPASLRDYQGVIGRDLLSRWESLVYEGRRGRLTIRDTPGGLFGWLERR
jgi:hypothetical protein